MYVKQYWYLQELSKEKKTDKENYDVSPQSPLARHPKVTHGSNK